VKPAVSLVTSTWCSTVLGLIELIHSPNPRTIEQIKVPLIVTRNTQGFHVPPGELSVGSRSVFVVTTFTRCVSHPDVLPESVTQARYPIAPVPFETLPGPPPSLDPYQKKQNILGNQPLTGKGRLDRPQHFEGNAREI
jgi:hypothetical protein